MQKFLFIIMLLVVFACSKETELQKSIFLHDADFPGLPQYSEWGYNTFGAYYDREAFVSNAREVPVKVIHEDNKTSFVFKGQKGGEYYGNSNSFTMTLTTTNFHPASYAELIALHDTTFDLTEPAYEISLDDRVVDYTVEILNGSFRIRRAQHLLVDDQPEEVILSGTFEFQALINGEPISISNGRFDVGVGDFNFFKY